MKKQRQQIQFNGWSDQLQGVGTFSAKAHALATPKTTAPVLLLSYRATAIRCHATTVRLLETHGLAPGIPQDVLRKAMDWFRDPSRGSFQ